jgi:hypothetical protein
MNNKVWKLDADIIELIIHVFVLVLDLVQVRLRRKVGRDGLGTFAAFRMLLVKIGAKICCCSQLASHASVGKIRR